MAVAVVESFLQFMAKTESFDTTYYVDDPALFCAAENDHTTAVPGYA